MVISNWLITSCVFIMFSILYFFCHVSILSKQRFRFGKFAQWTLLTSYLCERSLCSMHTLLAVHSSKRLFIKPAYFFNCLQWEHCISAQGVEHADSFTGRVNQRSSMSLFTPLSNHSAGGAGQLPHQPTGTSYLHSPLCTTTEKKQCRS